MKPSCSGSPPASSGVKEARVAVAVAVVVSDDLTVTPTVATASSLRGMADPGGAAVLTPRDWQARSGLSGP